MTPDQTKKVREKFLLLELKIIDFKSKYLKSLYHKSYSKIAVIYARHSLSFGNANKNFCRKEFNSSKTETYMNGSYVKTLPSVQEAQDYLDQLMVENGYIILKNDEEAKAILDKINLLT